ncbi:MAG: alanine racemase, partial [Alphaproteobacteria bacterium]
MKLADLGTPALILDRAILAANCAAMSARMAALGVALRPHMKTAKSIEVARLALGEKGGGITVSTLREAAYFIAGGIRDVTYAVGIAPAKLDQVAALERDGARLTILTDDLGVAGAIAARGAALGHAFRVLIEIDSGGGRGGVMADGAELLAIGEALHGAGGAGGAEGAELAGVLTHAGHSY